MILRIENLTDGNLSIEALRASFAVGEKKDVKLNRKLDSILIDNNAELAQLLADGDITLEEIGEVLKGYRSGLIPTAGPGAPTPITHNLGVAVERQKIEVLQYNLPNNAYFKASFYADPTGAGGQGVAVGVITQNDLVIYQGVNDAATSPPPFMFPTTHVIVTITVEGE